MSAEIPGLCHSLRLGGYRSLLLYFHVLLCQENKGAKMDVCLYSKPGNPGETIKPASLGLKHRSLKSAF